MLKTLENVQCVLGIIFKSLFCHKKVIFIFIFCMWKKSLSQTLLYDFVSQGLGTTKFMNFIGWKGYWPRSRFSHLDRHPDRWCFTAKKLQTKMQNHWLFSSNNIYFCKWQKADEKKVKRTSKICSSPFAGKMWVSTNQLH